MSAGSEAPREEHAAAPGKAEASGEQEEAAAEGSSEDQEPSGEAIIAKMEALLDEACACEDKACFEKTMQKIQEHGDHLEENEDLVTDEQFAQLEAKGPRFQGCAEELGVEL